MFTCETIKANGSVVEGSKEEFKDIDAVIQDLIESAAPEYCITIGFWLGGMDTQRPSTIDIPNGDKTVDRWTNTPFA